MKASSAILISALLWPLQGSSSECLSPAEHLPLPSLETSKLTNVTSKMVCEGISQIKSEDELRKAVEDLYEHQSAIVSTKEPKDRHALGGLFNSCDAEKSSKGLVIQFEGTGSYDPRVFDIYRKLIKCADKGKLDPGVSNYLYYKTKKFISSKSGQERKWSALSAGPLQQFMKDDELRSNLAGLQFASFPSEESELLAGDDALTLANLQKVPMDAIRSSGGAPKGVMNALKCAANYLASAEKRNIKPKIIVMSHSSGARSTVKFLELLKQKGVEVDLVFSIDPVKEAHHAVQEVLSQYSGNKARDLKRRFFDDVPANKPLNVWTRKQPRCLYRPANVKRWVSTYQNLDSEGLSSPIAFGIHGSPIHNADKNVFLKDGLGAKAHGEIATHETTLKLFKEEFLKLF